MEFKPSSFQLAIFDFIKNGSGNAVINAVAGSGKTTTIVKGLELIPENKTAIFLAFNKAIVEELTKRVPTHVEVRTLHSLGWSCLMKNYYKPVLNNNKAMNVINKLRNDVWKEKYEYGVKVRKLVDLLRSNLVSDPETLYQLAVRHDIEVVNGECERAFEVLNIMNENIREFDYSDMLYISALRSEVKMPVYDYIFIDECQDLNPAQQALLKKIMHSGTRFVAVGDPRQAIYGFAGADVESFNNLRSFPNTIELPLSVNYRCGRKIVDLAQRIVPQLLPSENASEGEVIENGKVDSIEDGDMVLCRNTAPLVELCLNKISQGQKAYVKGGDIGLTLINLVKKYNKVDVKDIWNCMNDELDKILYKLKGKNPGIIDADLKEMPQYHIFKEKIEVLHIIANNNGNPILKTYMLVGKIEDIFSDEKEGICFSTIHKAKGLEADKVHIIMREFMPSKYAKQPWQKVQETNLEYVAYTRAKKVLNFVEDWKYKRY